MSIPPIRSLLILLLTPLAVDASVILSDTFDPRQELPARKVSARKTLRLTEKGLSFPESIPLRARGGAALISGHGDRDNPVRYRMPEPVHDEIHVRFLLRYDAASIDNPPKGDGEFFVLWLDSQEGNDGATHSEGVPNLGLHVANGASTFMARVSAAGAVFSEVELKGDRTYLIVGRLSKRVPGKDQPYTRLEMWVDPDPKDKEQPLVEVPAPQRISEVGWIGFCTGRKTEPGDRITIDELAVGPTWESVLGLPAVAVKRKPTPKPKPREVDFRREVYPILKSRCFRCHQGADARSGHRLDVRAEILGESNGYPLAIPGESSKSRLYTLVNSPDSADNRMPPSGPRLTEQEVAILRDWIDSGLSWDDGLLPPADLKTDHWAFQPVRRPELPASTDAIPARNPIDRFIAARQQEKGTQPAAQASRSVLIRRLSLDLLGLPPTPEEVARFVEDSSADAYERLVERLLASPHYGERWGRHWLDLARWAESNGHQHNKPRPHAWRYRDYVVRSFNANKPYERFLLEQLAGDEMETLTDEGLIATGFLAAARYSGNELDKPRQRNDVLVDVVNATSSSLLGLTMGCAQCHNHKFDPITARDYYRFQGFFIQGQPVDVILRDQPEGSLSAAEQIELDEMVRERVEIFESTRKRLVDQERRRRPKGTILIIRTSVIRGMTPQQRRRYDELGARIDALRQAWSFYSPATSPHRVLVNPQLFRLRWPMEYDPSELLRMRPRLWVRGEVSNPGPFVDVGWPAIFGPVPAETKERSRTALARWLTSRENPLTARVWVNRIWHYHFGRGLVTTPNNFGTQGARPTHPQLLDWLASELIDSGWDTRWIHRLILHSHTYRQAAHRSEGNAALDPEETTYWRWKPRRLEAEAVRDSTLAAAGELDLRIGGPGSTDADSNRRAMYLFQRRAELPHMQTLFDGSEPIESCGRRHVSTVPLQPLFLMNNPFMLKAAEALARRVRKSAGEEPARQIEAAYQLVLSRPPELAERERLLAYLESSSSPGQDRLTALCQVLLNLNEFLYVP